MPRKPIQMLKLKGEYPHRFMYDRRTFTVLSVREARTISSRGRILGYNYEIKAEEGNTRNVKAMTIYQDANKGEWELVHEALFYEPF